MLLDIDNLDTLAISLEIKKFLADNNIEENNFYKKILHTSYLTYKNLVESPQLWQSLNSTFKLYYKRTYMFLNDKDEQDIFLKQVRNSNDEDTIGDGHIFIHYDISQIDIKYNSTEIIEKAIKKLSENNLSRKVLCDSVLGIPLNTLSFFSNRIKNWSNQSDYAKEAIMRMYAWFTDPDGVNKLVNWKKMHYLSKTLNLAIIFSQHILKSAFLFIHLIGEVSKLKCASRMRKCLSSSQLKVLLDEFEVNPSPSKDRIAKLSAITSLNAITISRWFKNKIYNHEKSIKERNTNNSDKDYASDH